MLNKWTGIGRLTKDPELKYTPGGHATCKFTLACDRAMKNQQGEKETDFINISIPPYKAKLAELCANYLRKGKLSYVEGELQIRSYDGQDGQKHWITEIIGDEVKFLSPKDDNQGALTHTPQQQYTQSPYQPPQQQHQYGQQPPYPGQFAPPGYQPQQPPQGQWQAPPPGQQPALPGYQPPHPNMPNPNFPPPQQQQTPQWLGQPPQNPPGAGQQLDLNQIGRQVKLDDDIPF